MGNMLVLIFNSQQVATKSCNPEYLRVEYPSFSPSDTQRRNKIFVSDKKNESDYAKEDKKIFERRTQYFI